VEIKMDILAYTNYVVAGIIVLAAFVVGAEVYYRVTRSKTHDKIDVIREKLAVLKSV
jgi:hypothetical protein